MPKMQSNCEYCQTPMTYYSSSYNGYKHYCSRQCQMNAARVLTTCPQCGKEFWYHRSWPRIYCSRVCSAAVNGIKNLGLTRLPPMYCEQCGAEIPAKKKVTRRRFCSRKCFAKHLSESQKGIPRPEVAGERPDLQKRVTKTCPTCGKEFCVKESHASRRICCSRECGGKLRSASGIISGENSPTWKGGYEPYYGPNWRQQRRNARYRDNYTCTRCGITESQLSRQLDVHHIIPFREFGIDRYREANASSNLTCLCFRCHPWVRHNGNGS